MNERIKELALKSGIAYAPSLYPNRLESPYVEDTDISVNISEFAELIVKECANIANAGIDPEEDYLIGDDILEHFGVEK